MRSPYATLRVTSAILLALAGGACIVPLEGEDPSLSAGTSASTGIDVAELECRVGELGVARAFNLFVLGDLTQTASDAEGRVAAAGDVVLTDYGLAWGLPADADRIDLLVGGTVSFTRGSLPAGGLLSEGAAALENVWVFGDVIEGPGFIDFQEAGATLRALSDSLAGLAPNGTTSVDWHGDRASVELVGEDERINVFAVDGGAISAAHTFRINVPSGASVVVNVSGEDVTLTNFGMLYQGAVAGRTLFNLPQAVTVNATAIGVEGSLLAPRAALAFSNGQINGQVVVASVTGPGQFNHVPLDGCLPVPPEEEPGDDDEPPPPPVPGDGEPGGDGCTRTIGYWSTHAGAGPQADQVTALLPLRLGTAGGAHTLKVTTAAQARAVLSQQIYGSPDNGITKLYAQMLGSKLNVAAGAPSATIADTIAAADAFLAAHDYSAWSSLSAEDQAQVLAWKDVFDEYNNGRFGPAHCD